MPMPRIEITDETANESLDRIGADEPLLPIADLVDHSKFKSNGGSFDAHAWVKQYLNGSVAEETTSGGSTIYRLKACPFDENHKSPDAAIIVRAGGAAIFRCLHSSCSGKNWQDFRVKFEPDAYKAKETAKQSSQQQATSPITFEAITPAELKDCPAPEYLIDGILELSQPGVIAGQYKSLKTTMAVELIYCLSTGEKFLGEFQPNRTVRCGMFSGEAGRSQLQSTFKRIAEFHGDYDPWHHPYPIFSCERLPKIGDALHMDAFKRWIEKDKLEVAIIDPGYAALSAIGDSAGNYYKVADLLFQVTDLQRQTGCAILLCPHMTKAPKYDPPMLSDIQWSGFGEWSGQWLLLGKRREWDDQTGQHWLWLVVGGRSGHAETFGVDVFEGKQLDIAGKVFRPSLVDRGAAFRATADADSERRDRQQVAEQGKAIEAIKAAFTALGDGWHVKAHVMERTGTSGRGKAVTAAWASMLRSKQIESDDKACKGGNNVPCAGYRLRRSS